MRRLKGEPSCYVNGDGAALILVYVDDLLMAGDSTSLDNLTSHIQQRALLKTIGSLTSATPLAFLGRQLTTDGESIHVGMSPNCIADVLKAEGLDKC